MVFFEGQEGEGLRGRHRGHGRADLRFKRPLEALDLLRGQKDAHQGVLPRQGWFPVSHECSESLKLALRKLDAKCDLSPLEGNV